MNAQELLERGRSAYEGRNWSAAQAAFSQAAEFETLAGQDLQRLALAAFMQGHREEFRSKLAEAYYDFVSHGDPLAASRAAFWLGFEAGLRGLVAEATAWLSRAQRALATQPDDVVERGYLLLPVIQRHLAAGAYDKALDLAGRAVALAEVADDADLHAFALHAQGLARLRQGFIEEALALLDEAMLTVVSRDPFPIVAGVVYCSVISACRRVLDLRRMQQWTGQLAAWCERQTGVVMYLGECKVYRSELLQLGGDWEGALHEAEQAIQLAADDDDRRLLGLAWYQLGELRRLRGETAAAESAYRRAHEFGKDPHPGLAELWLQSGEIEAALKALERALGEVRDFPARFRLLPAYIRILIDSGEVDSARTSCEELTRLSHRLGAPVDLNDEVRAESLWAAAIARACTGEVVLAMGEPERALAQVRSANTIFQELGAPLETARTRVTMGTACSLLGDEEGARMEFEAALSLLERGPSTAELERVESLLRSRVTKGTGLLSPRESEVLARLAAGLTNREIATELGLSIRTVDRHVSNIFDKLGVRTRSAAAAQAVEHHLL